jgi:hypothetical protein
MRVVLDSNILVAAFATQGLCQAVFELCLEKHQIIISNELLKEVRDNLIKKLKLPERLAFERIQFLRDVSELNETGQIINIRCNDPNDLHVLSLAINNGAECIVSGDADLLEITITKGIRILSPRELWEMERESSI